MLDKGLFEKIVDWGDAIKKKYPRTEKIVDVLIGEKEKPFDPIFSRGSTLKIPIINAEKDALSREIWNIQTLNPAALFVNKTDAGLRTAIAERMGYMMESRLRGVRPIALLSSETGERKYAVFGTYTDHKKREKYPAMQLVDRAEMQKLSNSSTKWSKSERVIPLDQVEASSEGNISEELLRKLNIIREATKQADEASDWWKNLAFNGFGLMILANAGLGHFGLISTFVLSLTAMVRFAELSVRSIKIAHKNMEDPMVRAAATLFID